MEHYDDNVQNQCCLWHNLIADPNALDNILTTDNEAYLTFQEKSVEAVPGGYACHNSIFTETSAAYASVAENTYEECDVYINAEESNWWFKVIFKTCWLFLCCVVYTANH